MKTVTVSMRIPEAEAERLAKLARDLNLERSALLKQAVKRGTDDLVLEYALQAYRNGEATLSRAAEIAGIGLRDLLLKLQPFGLELSYDPQELETDLSR